MGDSVEEMADALEEEPTHEAAASSKNQGEAGEEEDQLAAATAEASRPAPSAPAVQDNAPKSEDIFMLARQQNFTVASKLLEAYPHLWHARDLDGGHSLLHWAALVGNKEFCKDALDREMIPVDAQATNLQTPLMWAVLRGHVRTARLLLEHKADMRLRDSLGATAMMISIQHAAYPCMLLLMARGDKGQLCADTDKNGCGSTHWAAYKGDVTALKLLNYFGADLLALDNAGMQPMHRAVFGSQTGVVEFLMELKADPLLRNNEGKNCLDIAESQGDIGMQNLFKKLLRKGKAAGKEPKDLEMNAMSEESSEKKSFGQMMQSTMKDKSMHKVFPLFWLVCVSLGLFQYIMDLRSTSYKVAPYASMFFELGIPLSLAIFAFTALGDPGKVPPKTPGNSGVEDIMRALDSPEEHVVDMSRLCTTTWVLKGLRSKYCTQTGAVVQEFDHYCIWLNCAIGRDNHRPFVLLAVTEFLTQLSHLYLLWAMARELVTVPGMGSWIFGVCTSYPLLALMFFLHAFTAPWVFMLFLHQSRLVAMNLTTNEMMNAGRYEHFWTSVGTGFRMQKVYRNPFNKGNMMKNCLDFWWTRRRAHFGPVQALDAQAAAKMSGKSCCANHAHGHGGHGHGHGH
jgi:ankyrin repeat protein